MMSCHGGGEHLPASAKAVRPGIRATSAVLSLLSLFPHRLC
jgi:hypothetical protein